MLTGLRRAASGPNEPVPGQAGPSSDNWPRLIRERAVFVNYRERRNRSKTVSNMTNIRGFRGFWRT